MSGIYFIKLKKKNNFYFVDYDGELVYKIKCKEKKIYFIFSLKISCYTIFLLAEKSQKNSQDTTHTRENKNIGTRNNERKVWKKIKHKYWFYFILKVFVCDWFDYWNRNKKNSYFLNWNLLLDFIVVIALMSDNEKHKNTLMS